MKNLQITTSCIFYGQQVEAGTVLKDVSTQDAANLIAAGRAISYGIEHRSPEIEHRDPKPARVKAR